MGTPSIFIIFVLPQTVVIGIILIVLKAKLDGNLIDLAITQLEAGRVKPEGSAAVVVITHKAVSADHRERILKAATKNIPGGGAPQFQIDSRLLGGMIIKLGSQVVDYSLIDRLRKAR